MGRRFVVADIKARWTVQREIYVQEEVQGLCTSLLMDGKEYVLDTEKSQLNKYKEGLQRLDDQYWDNCRLCWTLEGNTPSGSVKRALKTYRMIPSGASVNGCVRTALGAVDAVDETVDAVKGLDRHTANGTEGTAPVPVAVAFAADQIANRTIRQSAKMLRNFRLTLSPTMATRKRILCGFSVLTFGD